MILLVAAMLVSADPTASAPQTPPAPIEKPKKAKRICKRQDVDTGSHMAKSLCLTEDQWNARHEGISADEYEALQGRVGP